MLESMRWMQWLEVEQRHLVWMRAKHYEWKFICRRLGRDRTTAWRRWQKEGITDRCRSSEWITRSERRPSFQTGGSSRAMYAVNVRGFWLLGVLR